MKKSIKYFLISVMSVLLIASLLLVGCGEKKEIIDDRTVLMSKTEIYLPLGDEEELTARLSVGKGKFNWSSSDESVAVVTDGTVKGVSLGVAEITAECGTVKGVCVVNVVLKDGYPIFANSVQKIELFENDTSEIDSRVLFNGEEVAAELSFFSEDEEVATVSSEGVIKGIKEGSTVVSVIADYEGLVNSLKIPVIVRNEMIIEAESDNILLQLVSDRSAGYSTDKTIGIRAIKDFEEVTDNVGDVRWSAKNDSIVSVSVVGDANGEKRASITAIREGTTSVVCSFEYLGKEFKKEFAVTVEKAHYEGETAVAYDSEDNGSTLSVIADIPSVCTITENLFVTMGSQTLSFVNSITGERSGVVVSSPSGLEKGETEIVVSDEKWEIVFTDSYYCTGVLTQESHKVLQAGGVISAGEIYVMTEDINVGYTSDSDPLIIYGTLDGLGHTISGITISVEPKSGWAIDPIVNAHTYSAYISENNGTIKNVMFDFTSETLGSEQSSAIFITLVQVNRGVIENVVVSGKFDTDAYRMSALVGKLYGTVKNTITLVPESATNYRHRIAGIAIFMYGGIVQNSYTCGRNFENADETDAEGQNRCYLEKYNGGANVISWKGFSDASEIADAENFSDADGWSSYWTKKDNDVAFGGKSLSFESREYFSADYAEETNDEITIEILSEVTFEGVQKVYFGNIEAEFVSFENGELTVKKGDISYGTYNVIVETSAGKYEAKNVRFVTKAFKQSDVNDFKSIINARPEGYFLLTEDLDFGLQMTEGTIKLTGTLDGNGYSLKNLLIRYDNRGNDWESYLFSENAGTIKDLGVVCSLYMNGSKSSFVYKNTGTISNVFMDVTYLYGADQWKTAPLVNTNGGLVENCAVVIRAEDGVTVGNEVAAIVGTNQSTGTISYCYAVTNGFITGNTVCAIDEGSQEGVYVYNLLTELASSANFDKANGWSEFWIIEGTDIAFGRYE